MTSLESFFQDGDQKSWALFVDCSSFYGTLAAISPRGEVITSYQWDKKERHTNILVSYFLEICRTLNKSHLSRIFFIQGPGSFTGLRVGASFIKSLAFGLGGIPIFSCSSFIGPGLKVIKENNKENLQTETSKTEDFYITIPSIGSKFFYARFIKNNGTWIEEINFNGATSEHLDAQKVYSFDGKDIALKSQSKFSINTDDLVQVFSNPQVVQPYIKNSTYLDLYPLYLRQSEAEEKYRYDKTKLQQI